MPWRMYKVVFRIKTPIHIGYRKYGNLMQTRPYVPARVFLGALTARITRKTFGQTRDWKHYRIVGEILNQIFTASYFYPTTDKEGGINLFPWDDNFPFYRFVGSYVSTALENEYKTAKEGTLHEVEYISPKTRDNGEQVYLSGYFLVKKNHNTDNIFPKIEENLKAEYRKSNLSDEELTELLNLLQNIKNDGKFTEITKIILQNWQNITENLQIGGERGYGWGSIERVNPEGEKWESENSMFGKYEVVFEEDRPIIKIPKDKRIPAHLIVENDHPTLSGEVEPLVRREWRESPGSEVVFDGIAYKPGAEAMDGLKLTVVALGYLTTHKAR